MADQSAQASGYFGAVHPKDPSEDIVARQRGGGDRPLGGVSRRRRPRDIWFIGYALDNSLPLLMALVLAAGAGAVGVVAWSWTNQERSGDAVAVNETSFEVPVLHERRPGGSYLAGGELNSVENLVASRFGRPLYMGDGGLPVIEVYMTGQIREMTVFEANFPSANALSVDYSDPPDVAPGLRRYEKPDVDYDGVYFHPGPDGEGVWWQDPTRDSLVSRGIGVDRASWEIHQLEMLGEALPSVEAILLSYQDTDLSDWDKDWVVNVHGEAERLTERFVAGKHEEWAMVPYRFTCDGDLELERTEGVTRGCPSVLLQQALSYMWARYGKLVHSLWALARVNHPDFRSYYGADVQSTGIYFTRYAERLIVQSELLTASFRDVVHISASEGFDFASLTWMGYPEGLLDARYVNEY